MNLVVAWLLIAVGFVMGFVLGLNFHREDWLGGYGSRKRRLYRLGHIATIALAMINILFYFTAQTLPHPNPPLEIASWGFIIGAVTMPLCCFWMAHDQRARAVFVVPVLSLAGSALLVFREVLR
ncbi:MAG: hypothetical protein HY304_06380 [candidate division Zixibacteria bacterium]|nr:hypothetical protein [candidate division Zixibacteria bacterium]